MEQIFLRILNMSITAGYCVLVVMILRLLLQKMPKIYSYALWAVVYFRLVCPVSIKSVLSLVRVNTQTIPMDIGVRETPRIYSGSARVDAVVNEGIRQTIPQTKVEASVNPMQVVLFVAAVTWLLVAAMLIFYSFWSVFRLKRQLAKAKWVEQNIYEAGNLQTPFVLGFFRPCIYLPASLRGREREYVLAHEKTHIKRRDYLIKQAAFLVTCVYWFHPLVWLAFYQMCRDMEMSCDESVIRRMGGEIKKEYSASLLSLASGRQIVNGSPLAFGEGGIKARITNVLHYKRPTFWVSIFFVAVLTMVLLGLALNPEEVEADYKIEETEMSSYAYLYELDETETVEDGAGDIERVEETAANTEGYQETKLHLYVPKSMQEAGYVDLESMPEEYYIGYARQAMQELYELTGTQIEECYYYYTKLGGFVFALTEDDLEHDRTFYSRYFGSGDMTEFSTISSIDIGYARRCWYSPVYQYQLPLDFDSYADSEKAVWFLKQSGVYNGKEVEKCIQPYSAMPQTWQIVMEDGTAYEISLDMEIDGVSNITGPYPDEYINH